MSGGYQSDAISQESNLRFGTTSGSAGTYLLTLDPSPEDYTEGLVLQVRFHTVNTGAASLNVNGLGAIPIKKIVDGELVDTEADDLNVTPIYDLKYDGGSFQVVLPGGEGSLDGVMTLKGTIDASTFPPLPEAEKGDLYTVTGAGFIGDSDGGSGLEVSVGDVIYALEANEGGAYVGLEERWNALKGIENESDEEE